MFESFHFSIITDVKQRGKNILNTSSRSEKMGFTIDQLYILAFLRYTTSGISFVASLFVIIVYYRFKELHIFTFRLVRNVAFCDILH